MSVAKITIRLVIITIIAGVLLGGTYEITKAPIAEQEIKSATEARQKVLAAADYQKFDVSAIKADKDFSTITEVYIAKDESGADIGATIAMTARGFNPGINLTVGVKSDGTVSGIAISAHEETPGLGAKMTEEQFYSQFTGQPADGSISVIKSGDAKSGEIKSIAGATKTSAGVTKAVNLAANCYTKFVRG